MPPRKSITLTEAELRLMKILWARGESAVGELVAAMPEGEALAYNSVLTTVRILEQKGVCAAPSGGGGRFCMCLAWRSMRRAVPRFDI